MTLLCLGLTLKASAFVHPGGLHTQADFARMAAKVSAGEHPWIDSYNQLTGVSEANLSWGWAPVTQIIRGGTGSNYSRSQKDALAIYYLALRYQITGDTSYADKAIQGMDAWSSTMTNGVGGDSNWALGAGICGYEFAVAGEALRGYSGWSQTSINNYASFLLLFESGNHAFLTSHNNACDTHYWVNWDACNLASMITIGVFCDDTNIFNEAVTYFKQGIGNGNITSAAWYIHTNGLAQWEESGRDQAHTMDGIAWLGVVCQVAWNQSVDLYGYDNNLFLRGIEYAAKYNLGNDVPYVSFHTCDSGEDFGTTNLSGSSRGFLPPIWDMLFNHYVNVEGLQAPYTTQAAANMRPDGFYNNANSPDFVGFTTLTCLQDPTSAGVPPSGLMANISGGQVNLNWWGTAYATNYVIKRATVSGGPYTTIGTVPASADREFLDADVTNGMTYCYVVSAGTPTGETANSAEKAVTIGNQLVAYYKFDESGGTTAADSSGFGRPAATLINGATFTSGAVSLDGNSQYVALPNGLLKGLHDFTISAWVYLNNVSSSASLFDFGADLDRYMYLVPDSNNGKLQFGITKFTGTGAEVVIGSLGVTAGAWHHVAVTLQGSEGSGEGILYLDGVPVGTNSAMSYYPDMIGSLDNATNNWIGRAHSSSYPYLNGMVYDFRIYNGALGAAQIATLASSATPPSSSAAPTGLSATAVSSSQVNLSWNPSSEATSYTVYRGSISGGPYTAVAGGMAGTYYDDTGLSGNSTYYYVVAAINDGGVSPDSAEAQTTTLTQPGVPTGLTATVTSGTQVNLSWNASAGAASYNIKRSMNSGGPYVTVATGITSTFYTDIASGGTFYYVVSDVNSNGESDNSSEVGGNTAPAAPTGLTASAGVAEVSLSWNTSLGATSYSVKRATTTGGPYTTITTGIMASDPYATTANYLDSTAANGTTYYYVVSSVGANGEGPDSPELCVTPNGVAIQVTASMAGTGTTSASAPTLATSGNFNLGGGNVVALVVTDESSSTNPTVSATFAGQAMTLGVATNETYQWAGIFYLVNPAMTNGTFVITSDASSTGLGYSAIALSHVGSVGEIAAAANTSSSGTVGLTYTTHTNGGFVLASVINNGYDASHPAPGFDPDNKANQTLYGPLLLPGGSSGHLHVYGGVSAAGTYTDIYTNEFNTAGQRNAYVTLVFESAGSEASLPQAPTGLSATGGDSLVNLNWTQSASPGVTGNNVYRSTVGSGGPYNLLANLAAATSYSDTAVSAGMTYYYSVTAVNATGESAMSGYSGATTIPPTPTGLAATAVATNQINLSWTASSGALSYNVKRATVSGGPYTAIATGVSVTNYSDSSLSSSTTYYYVVSAVNSSGESANSAEASATTFVGNAAIVTTAILSGVGTNSATAPTLATSGNFNINGGNVVALFVTDESASTAPTVSATFAGQAMALGVSTNESYQWAGIFYLINPNMTNGAFVITGNAGSTGMAYSAIALANVASVADTTAVTNTLASGTAGLTYTTSNDGGFVLASVINNGWDASDPAPGFDPNNNANQTLYGPMLIPGGSSGHLHVYGAVPTAGTYTDIYTNEPNSGQRNAYVTLAFNSGLAPSDPAVPAGLTAAAGDAQVALSWNASTGASGYNVKRATVSGGPYTTIATGVGSTSYTDTTVANGTTYYYVVSAVNSSGESANSSEVSATPSVPSQLVAPANLAATPGRHRQISLTWTQSTSSNITGNNIYRATISGGPYTLVASMSATKSYKDTGLNSGTTYYYVVTAIDSSGQESPDSNEAGATAP